MNKFLVVFTLFLPFFLGSCSQTPSSTSSWSLQMREMADNYEKLLPFMFDSERYFDKNNEKFISLYLKNINASAADLDRHTAKGLSGNDPLFEVGLKGLKTMIQKASESYFVENYDYSQKLLQASVQYCNSCHTRTNFGPTFIKWDKFESITDKMNPVDHADILVATRQFPKAVNILEQGLSSGKIAKTDRKEAVEKMMVVSLRNINDPQQALNLLNGLPPQVASELKELNIKDWKTYLTKWAKGQLKSQNNVNNLLKSKTLDGKNFVEALHNSMILHESLSTVLEPSKRAQVYFWLGKIYQKHKNLTTWRLPENYYETCIYEVPGSQQALKCYYSLESLRSEDPKFKSSPLLSIEESNLKKLKILATEKPSSKSPLSTGAGSEDL